MTSSRFWLVVAAAGVLLALTLVARSTGRVGPPPADRANLSYTLKDMNGSDVRLADFAGKPLIVNLWATWCEPCKIETPQLVTLSAKFRDRGLTIVGISVDDAPEQIRAFAAEHRVTYPMLVGLNRDEVLTSFGYEGGIPLTVFIRADGTVAHRVIGLATTETWERRISGLF